MKLDYQRLISTIKERTETQPTPKLTRSEELKRNLRIKKLLTLVVDMTTDEGKKILAKRNAGLLKHQRMLEAKNAKTAM